MGSANRSSTADWKRRAVSVPASHRLRSTATVSTSTRSGADTAASPRMRARDERPSGPSSPTTLAKTDASMTINGCHGRRRGRALLPRTRLGLLFAERFGRGHRSSSVLSRAVSALLRGTAAAIGLQPRLVAEGSHARRWEDREPRCSRSHVAATFIDRDKMAGAQRGVQRGNRTLDLFITSHSDRIQRSH